MLKKLIVAAAAFGSIALGVASSSPPAGAQIPSEVQPPGEVQTQSRAYCLRNNRIWGWDVVDDRTMIVTDRQRNRFRVHLDGGCIGLTSALVTVSFRTPTSLGCLQPGDRVFYRARAFPGNERMSCFVRGIELIDGPRFNRAAPWDYYDHNYDRSTDYGYYDRSNPYYRR
jgi:hypothetical protein